MEKRKKKLQLTTSRQIDIMNEKSKQARHSHINTEDEDVQMYCNAKLSRHIHQIVVAKSSQNNVGG